MTKEFSLVLLGSGLLTAGWFAWPGEDLERNAQQAAAQQVGGHRTYRTHYVPIFISTPRFAGGGTAAAPSISRGGFGGTGHGFTGIGG